MCTILLSELFVKASCNESYLVLLHLVHIFDMILYLGYLRDMSVLAVMYFSDRTQRVQIDGIVQILLVCYVECHRVQF